MVTTLTGFAAAQAYGQSRGLDLILRVLLDRAYTEQPTFHGLIDLDNGIYVAPDDVIAGITNLIEHHSGVASMQEVLEEEYGGFDRPPLMLDEDQVPRLDVFAGVEDDDDEDEVDPTDDEEDDEDFDDDDDE